MRDVHRLLRRRMERALFAVIGRIVGFGAKHVLT